MGFRYCLKSIVFFFSFGIFEFYFPSCNRLLIFNELEFALKLKGLINEGKKLTSLSIMFVSLSILAF